MNFKFSDKGKTIVKLDNICYLKLEGATIKVSLKNSFAKFIINYENEELSKEDFNRVVHSNWCDIHIPNLVTKKSNIIAFSGDPDDMSINLIFENGLFEEIPMNSVDKLNNAYSYLEMVMC